MDKEKVADTVAMVVGILRMRNFSAEETVVLIKSIELMLKERVETKGRTIPNDLL